MRISHSASLLILFTFTSQLFLCSLAADVCGVRGYSVGTSQYAGLRSKSVVDLETCFTGCASNSDCVSVAVGMGMCLFFAATIDGNFQKESTSPWVFYDKSCASSGLLSGLISVPNTLRLQSRNTKMALAQRASMHVLGPSIICGSPGWDRGNPLPIDSLTNLPFIVCAAACEKSTRCMSFAFGGGNCILYAAPVAGNFDEDPGSQLLFYDVPCHATGGPLSATPSAPTPISSSTTPFSSTRTPFTSTRPPRISGSTPTPSLPTSTFSGTSSTTTSFSTTSFSSTVGITSGWTTRPPTITSMSTSTTKSTSSSSSSPPFIGETTAPPIPTTTTTTSPSTRTTSNPPVINTTPKPPEPTTPSSSSETTKSTQSTTSSQTTTSSRTTTTESPTTSPEPTTLSTSTSTSTTTTSRSPTPSRPPSTNRLCGFAGYANASTIYFDDSGNLSNLTACGKECQARGGGSYGYGSGSCLVFAGTVSQSVTSDPRSPYLFFDATCKISISR